MIYLPHEFKGREKEYWKEYHKNRNQNPEIKTRHNKLQKQWSKTSKGIISQKAIQRRHYLKHQKQKIEKSRKYRFKHPGQNIQWNQSEAGKISFKKHAAKRRQLGFIPLNKYFEGCEAHHISENFIIYVPEEIHQSIRHNIWTWRGMDAINKLAVEWL